MISLVGRILGSTCGEMPAWLIRPGKAECGACWPLVRSIYHDLTGLELPDVMRPIERREIDAIIVVDGEAPRLLEVDERQHFNQFRSHTLRQYRDEVPLAFDSDLWIGRGEQKMKLEGGGFAKPKPPLFPGENGRHRQRAFRDALADILPLEYGWLPTLRVADFEVDPWINCVEAEAQMTALLKEKLRCAGSVVTGGP